MRKQSIYARIAQVATISGSTLMLALPSMIAYADDGLFGTLGGFIANTYNTAIQYALVFCGVAAAAAAFLWAVAPSDKAAQFGKTWLGRILIGFVIMLIAPLIIEFIQNNVGVVNLTNTGIATPQQ